MELQKFALTKSDWAVLEMFHNILLVSLINQEATIVILITLRSPIHSNKLYLRRKCLHSRMFFLHLRL